MCLLALCTIRFWERRIGELSSLDSTGSGFSKISWHRFNVIIKLWLPRVLWVSDFHHAGPAYAPILSTPQFSYWSFENTRYVVVADEGDHPGKTYRKNGMTAGLSIQTNSLFHIARESERILLTILFEKSGQRKSIQDRSPGGRRCIVWWETICIILGRQSGLWEGSEASHKSNWRNGRTCTRPILRKSRPARGCLVSIPSFCLQMRLRPQYLLLFSRLNIGRQNIKANPTFSGMPGLAPAPRISNRLSEKYPICWKTWSWNKACCFGILSGPSRSTGLISIGLRHVRETSIVKLCVLSPFEASRSHHTSSRGAQGLSIVSVRSLRIPSCLFPICSNPAYGGCSRLQRFTLLSFGMLKSWLLPLFGDSKLHHVCCRYAQIPPIAWVWGFKNLPCSLSRCSNPVHCCYSGFMV